ncbi:High mobility group B protein 1 [Dendrobium catenatum]|uniref:High mobility group B protein 1 n=1 Tax=Dendrobium catenatum TaxID=906689 RepID=A0A2I0WIV9_9ASPA|nr:High mobility group B protein 1 [Dendrobium catenatum]
MVEEKTAYSKVSKLIKLTLLMAYNSHLPITSLMSHNSHLPDMMDYYVQNLNSRDALYLQEGRVSHHTWLNLVLLTNTWAGEIHSIRLHHLLKGGKGKATTAKKETPEVLKPSDDRLGKRKAAVKADRSSKSKANNNKKAKKDPNKPKRPASAFFVFLEEFREIYKREHPNVKAVSVVGKAGGEKWKSLTRAEKAPYEAKAAKKKD